MFCVLADRLECAELLLKAGAQTNQKDKGGRTALHWAAHKVRIKTHQSFQQPEPADTATTTTTTTYNINNNNNIYFIF